MLHKKSYKCQANVVARGEIDMGKKYCGTPFDKTLS